MSSTMQHSPNQFLMGDDQECLLSAASVESLTSCDEGGVDTRSLRVFMVGQKNELNINLPAPGVAGHRVERGVNDRLDREVNLHIDSSCSVVPNDSKLLGERNSLRLRIHFEGQEPVEIAVCQKMNETGCFSGLKSYFRAKLQALRRICRGSIILDLTPDSPEALKRLLDAMKGGEINELVLQVLRKREIFEQISGTDLRVKVELIVSEDVFQASGLSLADLQNLPTLSTVITMEQQEKRMSKEKRDVKVMDSSQRFSDKQDGQQDVDATIHLILIGRSGVGKSTLANILTRSNAFLSKLSGSPVTKECQTGRFIRDRVLYNISDTPGIDDESNSETVAIKIGALIKSQIGRNIFLLVCRIGEWKEDKLALKYFKTQFGPNFIDNLIVVFTGKDVLDYEGLTLENYFATSSSLQQLDKDVEGRSLTVSKRDSPADKELFVSTLLGLVGSRRLRGRAYTWAMLQEAVRAEDERRHLQKDVEMDREMTEGRAIEDIVVQNLSDTSRHLDLQDIVMQTLTDKSQDRKMEDLQAGMRRLAAAQDDSEVMAHSQSKKAKTEVA